MDEIFLKPARSNQSAYRQSGCQYFTDGSNFVQDSTHFAGYAVVTLDAAAEAYLGNNRGP
jgi:hypothetical protein